LSRLKGLDVVPSGFEEEERGVAEGYNGAHAHRCGFEHSADTAQPIAASRVFPEQLHEGQQNGQAAVLIVDDDRDVCEVIGEALTGNDFRIECAYSAEEALRKVAAGGIDLALIDLLLPGGPGIELGKRFAAEGAAIIMMSGAVDAEERLAGTGFKLLRKPFRLQTLVEMVRDRVCG
jgi:CheY-like chemotaxis protein